jgi:hypothetical protein
MKRVSQLGTQTWLMINLPSQLLLDYNDLQKLPFYDMLDKVLTRDGLKLRFAAQIQKISSLFSFPFLGSV